MRHHYLTIEMPWPMAELSPNARGTWPEKARCVKTARDLAWALCADNAVVKRAGSTISLKIVFLFNPPTKVHFDIDGLVTRCKAYQDGIFDYLGIDDNLLVSMEARRGEKVKHGQVIITVCEDDDTF